MTLFGPISEDYKRSNRNMHSCFTGEPILHPSKSTETLQGRSAERFQMTGRVSERLGQASGFKFRVGRGDFFTLQLIGSRRVGK